MFQVVLYQPEIPPNTGNAMRLCANTGCVLHLIEPLGFDLDDAKLRRAGMDYRDKAVVRVHRSLDLWWDAERPKRVFAFAKAGSLPYHRVDYRAGDALLFGPESVGLPADVLSDSRLTAAVHIPMRAGVRSLNLSNAVAVGVFEAWRQCGFAGAEGR